MTIKDVFDKMVRIRSEATNQGDARLTAVADFCIKQPHIVLGIVEIEREQGLCPCDRHESCLLLEFHTDSLATDEAKAIDKLLSAVLN